MKRRKGWKIEFEKVLSIEFGPNPRCIGLKTHFFRKNLPFLHKIGVFYARISPNCAGKGGNATINGCILVRKRGLQWELYCKTRCNKCPKVKKLQKLQKVTKVTKVTFFTFLHFFHFRLKTPRNGVLTIVSLKQWLKPLYLL